MTTNTGVLRRLLASEAFARAELDTTWLDTHPRAFPPGPPDLALCAAAWALARPADGEADPFAVADGWRLGAPPAPVDVELTHDGARYRLHVDRHGGQVTLLAAAARGRAATAATTLPRVRCTATVHPEPVPRTQAPGTGLAATAGGRRRLAPRRRRGRVATARRWCTRARPTLFTVPDRLTTAAAAPADGLVSAPMPGLVRAVAVRAGEAVSRRADRSACSRP